MNNVKDYPMIIVIQRVKKASVKVNNQIVGSIDNGMLIFTGIEKGDSIEDSDYLAKRTSEFRIFEDSEGKMNKSIIESKGSALVVSQFTLAASTKKGRRPGFDKAASKEEAEALYMYYADALKNKGIHVETGEFKAYMQVELVNDGPVTFILKSKS